jgi:hypothetical protein
MQLLDPVENIAFFMICQDLAAQEKSHSTVSVEVRLPPEF